jgi:probable phosphoglycerate mutase|tara:strand:- start:569 stop:1099 length:531 start_codon:yes stop_codon:yes gene_type:complete
MTLKKLDIYLIRHGEKDKEGKFLSKRGIKQTKLLAKRFKKIKFNKIYSSDLDRCKQTTEIINKKLKLPTIYESGLREVKGKVKENPKKYKKEVNIIKKTYNKLVKEKGNILVSSSGIVNRILLSMFLKIDSDKANFIQNPTGVNLIDKNLEKNRFRILYINDTSHLPDKLKIRQKD